MSEWKRNSMNWHWVLGPTFAPTWYFAAVVALSAGVALGLPAYVGYLLLALCFAVVAIEYTAHVISRYRREKKRVAAAHASSNAARDTHPTAHR